MRVGMKRTFAGRKAARVQLCAKQVGYVPRLLSLTPRTIRLNITSVLFNDKVVNAIPKFEHTVRPVSFTMACSDKATKNIVFVHPDLGIGGAERLVIDAAVGLQSAGHKVTILTSHCDPKHCFEEARDGEYPRARSPAMLSS